MPSFSGASNAVLGVASTICRSVTGMRLLLVAFTSHEFYKLALSSSQRPNGFTLFTDYKFLPHLLLFSLSATPTTFHAHRTFTLHNTNEFSGSRHHSITDRDYIAFLYRNNNKVKPGFCLQPHSVLQLTLQTATVLIYHHCSDTATPNHIIPIPSNKALKMDSLTPITPSETINVAEQKSMPASAAISRAKAEQDRKAAKTAKAALHNAQQGHESSKNNRRKTRYAESQFPFLRLPAELRNRVVGDD